MKVKYIIMDSLFRHGRDLGILFFFTKYKNVFIIQKKTKISTLKLNEDRFINSKQFRFNYNFLLMLQLLIQQSYFA